MFEKNAKFQHEIERLCGQYYFSTSPGAVLQMTVEFFNNSDQNFRKAPNERRANYT